MLSYLKKKDWNKHYTSTSYKQALAFYVCFAIVLLATVWKYHTNTAYSFYF